MWRASHPVLLQEERNAQLRQFSKLRGKAVADNSPLSITHAA
jgi:hypothetical protein